MLKSLFITLVLLSSTTAYAEQQPAELGQYCCEWGTYMGRQICQRWCSTDVGQRPSPDVPGPTPPPPVNDGSRGKQE